MNNFFRVNWLHDFFSFHFPLGEHFFLYFVSPLLKDSKQRCDIQTQTFIAAEKYVNNIQLNTSNVISSTIGYFERTITVKPNMLPYNLKSEHRMIC